jgi:hypothetical protein
MERTTRSTVDVNESDIEKTIDYMEAQFAEGKIEAGPDQQERLDEATERLKAGEFHRDIDWDAEFWNMAMLLARCVDGRIPEEGANPLAPNAAGGTETIFVADDLTTKRYSSEDGTTAGGYRSLVTALKDKGYVVGGHTGSHAEGEKSDCGANDRLEAIYAYMANNPQALRDMAAALGVDVSDETHEMIVGNASARTQFSSGKELLGILEENAREEFVDKLHGDHKEVVAVINKRAGTTLDRDALREEFGEEYEAFNVDAWAFEEAARVTSLGEEEVQQKVAAMVYYNLATTMVLVGKKMRIVVLD